MTRRREADSPRIGSGGPAGTADQVETAAARAKDLGAARARGRARACIAAAVVVVVVGKKGAWMGFGHFVRLATRERCWHSKSLALAGRLSRADSLRLALDLTLDSVYEIDRSRVKSTQRLKVWDFTLSLYLYHILTMADTEPKQPSEEATYVYNRNSIYRSLTTI